MVIVSFRNPSKFITNCSIGLHKVFHNRFCERRNYMFLYNGNMIKISYITLNIEMSTGMLAVMRYLHIIEL